MGQLVIPNSFSPNTTAKAAQVNSNFAAVVTVINGGIDNTNITAGAIGASGGSDLNSHIVDNSTLQMSSNQLSIKTAGITQGLLATRPTGTSVAAGGVAVSASSGSFTSTSNTSTDVTNLSVTIVTTGRPVFIGVINSDNTLPGWVGGSFVSGGGLVHVRFIFVEGATVLAQYDMNLDVGAGTQGMIPASSLHTIQFPTAGSHTYKLQANSLDGTNNTNVLVTNAKLVAYEL